MDGEVWLEVVDVIAAVGISKQAVNKRLHSFATRPVKGRGGASGHRYQLLLSSLPAAWQAAYWQRHPAQSVVPAAEADPEAPAAPELPPDVRPRRGALLPLSAPALVLPTARAVPAATALVVAGSAAPSPTSRGAAALSSPEPAAARNDTAHLKDWQRRCLDARLALLQELDRRLLKGNPGAAMDGLIAEARAEQLPPELQALVTVANGKGGVLSRRTLARWLADRAHSLTDLAPRPRERFPRVPAWATPLLRLWQRPQKPALKWALEQLDAPGALPEGVPPPSYSAARRFLRKMDAIERNAGRLAPRALKNLRPYRQRDASGLWPTEIYSMDGHTFDAEVAHPFHGQPFRPEITAAIDIATRRLVGWSVALAESSLAVLDALRHSVETCGIPAILYVDNGSGYVNVLMEAPLTGFMARLGITKQHSLPFNSQARGVIERLHRTVWVRLAKEFATYMGADMDQEVRNRVHKLTRKDLKGLGESKLLPAWPDFLRRCETAVANYNARPHSSLPLILDPGTGQKRHQSPNESWADLTAANPSCLVAVAPDEVADLFRPYKTGKTVRGQVRLFGNLYYSPDLKGYHGETVGIGYDLHDPTRVWIRDRNQRLLCIAALDGNKGSYMAISALEHAHRARAQGRQVRLERRLEEVHLELHTGRPVLEGRAATPEESQQAAAELAALTAAPAAPADAEGAAANERPIFRTDLELWRWVDDHPDLATAQDRAYLSDLLASDPGFQQLVEIEAQKKSRVNAA